MCLVERGRIVEKCNYLMETKISEFWQSQKWANIFCAHAFVWRVLFAFINTVLILRAVCAEDVWSFLRLSKLRSFSSSSSILTSTTQLLSRSTHILPSFILFQYFDIVAILEYIFERIHVVDLWVHGNILFDNSMIIYLYFTLRNE